jgi:hypothetical protein
LDINEEKVELKGEISHQIDHVNETKDQLEQEQYLNIPNDFAINKNFYLFTKKTATY